MQLSNIPQKKRKKKKDRSVMWRLSASHGVICHPASLSHSRWFSTI
jgi:hypothetical protein